MKSISLRLIPRRLLLFVPLVVAAIVALACQGGGSDKPPGQVLYEANCQSCHGGPTGGVISDIPPKHNANGHTWHHPDQQIIGIILDGYIVSQERGEMPAFREKLTDAEISQILDYIKTWWEEDQRSHQATITAEWAR